VDSDYYRPTHKSGLPSAVIIAQLNPASIQRKGVEIAIRAAAEISQQVDGFQLSIVGPATPDGEALIESFITASAATNIVLSGRLSREAKRNLLAASWFYFQPSSHEGFGLAVLEAMACGAIPICSSAGSLPDVVGDGGILLPEANAAKLAAAVTALCGDSAGMEVLAAAARNQALRYDRIHHVEGLAHILADGGLTLPGAQASNTIS